MGRARDGAVSTLPTWFWGDVDAHDEGPHLRLRHAAGPASLLVRDGRLVRGHGYMNAPRGVRRTLARAGAIVRLRTRGRYLVHASGAVDPAGRAWLLSGDSGGGKSTLAYALARAGWRILGDDAVLLEVVGAADDSAPGNGAAVIAHPWRDPLWVSRSLAAEFPELTALAGGAHAGHANTDEGHPGDPRQRFGVAASMGRRAPVAAIVFVARGARRTISPLRGSAALAALVRQSPWVILNDRDARAHLDALRRVVALAPIFRLEHTPDDLHAVADILSGALA